MTIPMSSRGFPRVYLGAHGNCHGFPREPEATDGNPWQLHKAFVIAMGSRGFPMVPVVLAMGSLRSCKGPPWAPVGSRWNAMGCLGSLMEPEATRGNGHVLTGSQ